MEITRDAGMDFPTKYRLAVCDASLLSLPAFWAKLVELLPLSWDAISKVAAWTAEDFAEFRAYAANVRDPEFPASDEEVDRFGWVVTPLVVFITTIYAAAFPDAGSWGEAYEALLSAGVFVLEGEGVTIGDNSLASSILDFIEED